MNELLEKRKVLHQEIRILQDKIQNFEAHKPYTKFHYSNPEPNFNKRSVKGVVCRLLTCKESSYCVALETAAGGRVSYIDRVKINYKLGSLSSIIIFYHFNPL